MKKVMHRACDLISIMSVTITSYNFPSSCMCAKEANSEQWHQECSRKDFKIITLDAEHVKLGYCKAIILKQANLPIYYCNF